MNAERFETVGDFLAIRWQDGGESIIGLETLRRACPCAECAGETDVTGQLHRMGPPKPYFSNSFRVKEWVAVGHYAVQPVWEDGHATGLFTYDRLRELGETPGGDD